MTHGRRPSAGVPEMEVYDLGAYNESNPQSASGTPKFFRKMSLSCSVRRSKRFKARFPTIETEF
jgi:hypothetical protein